MMFVASAVAPAALPGLFCVSSERYRDPQQQHSQWACLQKVKIKNLQVDTPTRPPAAAADDDDDVTNDTNLL